MNYADIKMKLKQTQNEERYEHTKGVMYTAGCLAMAHSYPLDRAMLAGLLHDCAKCLPDHEILRLCREHNISVSAIEESNPFLLHAKLGAYLAETEYDITDPEILHAIKVHTTGEPDMSTLDKIIFIADYIEPGRDKAPNLIKVREMAYRDLNACMAQILRDTLNYLKAKGGSIDPTTEITYEFYKQFEEDHNDIY